MQDISSAATFYKMQGSGNDFILFDNTSLRLPVQEMPRWAEELCRRGFAVGADGMIFLDSTERADLDFIWHFFNSDGSRAEMCGNGSRCASLLADKIGLAGKEMTFGTDAGPIKAWVLENDLVKVQLTSPKDMKTGLSLILEDGKQFNIHHLNTGVPHAVMVCEDVKNADIVGIGRSIRYHNEFSPAGTNVNFIQILDKNSIFLRTYERGVEDETFACGTGAAASVVAGIASGLLESPVKVTTSGGEELFIDFSGEEVFLTGKAIIVYKAELTPRTFGL
ncbi:MAG: diaminopimelate epimerase [Desulfonatronovibrio sp.]